MSDPKLIGQRIRNYREKLELSLADLAENSGINVQRLEEYEAGEASPSIGAMIKLARALGQRVGTFMDDQHIPGPSITRVAERQAAIASHTESDGQNYSYQSLSAGKTDRHMEPFYVTISPNEDRGISSHEGEEFVIVISGKIQLIYGQETHILETGDSMYYNSIVPHGLSAVDGDAEICAVIYSL